MNPEIQQVLSGERKWVVAHGDNVEHMTRLRDAGERFALVYMDPPFCTGEVFKHKDGRVAFADPKLNPIDWAADVAKRCRFASELLDDRGTLFVHIDPRHSHYVRLELTDMYRRLTFASEIVWRYRRWPTKTPNFQRVHDTLLRYVRDPDNPRWNQLYEPLAPSTVATWGKGKQRAVVDATGRRCRSSATDEESAGVPMGDVWDISIIAPVAKERTGYPTQKPEALLERVILSSTDPGDAVLDPCMGSGTTLAVAQRLRRRAVGIDVSPVAIETTTRRLRRAQANLFGDVA